MSKALDIIRTEHRSIATVLENLRRLTRGRGGLAGFNSAVFGAMVNYLQDFADHVHHPKEDRYLFAPLRRHGAPAEDLIAGLEHDHLEGWRALLRLRHGYARLTVAGDAGLPEFARAVEEFVSAYFEHMRKEEEELFPLALKLFTPEEWDAIDRAFAEHRDPGPPSVTPRLHDPF